MKGILGLDISSARSRIIGLYRPIVICWTSYLSVHTDMDTKRNIADAAMAPLVSDHSKDPLAILEAESHLCVYLTFTVSTNIFSGVKNGKQTIRFPLLAPLVLAAAVPHSFTFLPFLVSVRYLWFCFGILGLSIRAVERCHCFRY